MTKIAGKTPIFWGQDLETDVAIIPFGNRDDAERYVRSQNDSQGRTRWHVVDALADLARRPDGTPAIMPDGDRVLLAGVLAISPAEAYDLAGAVAHASQGGHRIVVAETHVYERIVATLEDGTVDLDVEKTDHHWIFDPSAARRFAVRLASVASQCISIVRRTS